MLITESWIDDSHPWKINERDLKIFSNYETTVERQRNRLDENEIKHFVSKYILDQLDEKIYNLNLSIQLSQNIAKTIRQELSDKYKFYKIIIQTFVGEISKNLNSQNFKLYASYRFDQRTDKYLSITQNNGNM